MYKGDTNVLGIHLPAFDKVAINYFIDFFILCLLWLFWRKELLFNSLVMTMWIFTAMWVIQICYLIVYSCSIVSQNRDFILEKKKKKVHRLTVCL